MNKIALIVAYFGHLPNYFNLLVKSCTHNPTIDFYLFTDQKFNELPDNIYCIPFTLEKMREKASEVLGFEAALNAPYKCCDYKPLYGVLFSDYIKNYDYWGHCDVDLIWGDLQHFFDTYSLYDYDKFGVLGHLSLFKNVDKVNNAYLISNSLVDYKAVFTNNQNFAFDEIHGISGIMIQEGYKVFSKRIFVDIATIFSRYRITTAYPLDSKPLNYNCQSFFWDNGKIFHIYEKNGEFYREEYCYVHFQKRPNFNVFFNDKIVKSFYITKSGFYECSDAPAKELLNKLNPYKGVIYEMLESIFKTIRYKIKKHIKN